MFAKSIRSRRGMQRSDTFIDADYRLLNQHGKVVNRGNCQILDFSLEGLGLRVDCPFFLDDGIQISFFHDNTLYYCNGKVARDVSWSRTTGIKLKEIETYSLSDNAPNFFWKKAKKSA